MAYFFINMIIQNSEDFYSYMYIHPLKLNFSSNRENSKICRMSSTMTAESLGPD